MSQIPDGWIECEPHEAERFFDEVNGVLREFTETDFQYIVRVGIDVEVDCYKNQTQYWKFTPVKQAPLLSKAFIFNGFSETDLLGFGFETVEFLGKTVEITVKEVRK